jgi:hypothetical protein
MAPAGCTLDESGLGEQLDRYRRLGETAVSIQDGDAGLEDRAGVGAASATTRTGHGESR